MFKNILVAGILVIFSTNASANFYNEDREMLRQLKNDSTFIVTLIKKQESQRNELEKAKEEIKTKDLMIEELRKKCAKRCK